MYNQQKFIFEHAEEEEILGKIQEWMERTNIQITPNNRNTIEFYKDCKINTKMKKEKFSFREYYAFNQGIIDTKNKRIIFREEFDEIQQGAEFLATLHCNRNYIGEDITLPHDTFLELCNAFLKDGGDYQGIEPVWEPKGTEPRGLDMWLRYIRKMVWLDTSDRLLLALIGLPDAGKSPQCDFVSEMLDGLCAPIRANVIGEKGELQYAKDYPIWYQEDGSMGYAENRTLQILKTNFSKTGKIAVRDMYSATSFEDGRRFILIASNQCFKFSELYNTSATYKRFCVILCPNRFKKNEEFEDKIIESDFLDHMFSYFLNTEIVDVAFGFDQLEFQERNELMWRWSAYPIERVCKMLYVQSFHIGSMRFSMDVFKEVIEKMEEQKAQIPPKLNKKIKNALETMGIEFRRSTSGDHFIGIKKIRTDDKEIF